MANEIVFTGRCKICLSEMGQAVTRLQIAGVPTGEIVKMFPAMKLSSPMVSRHRNHYTDPSAINEVEDVSDHEFIDMSRRLAVIYLRKGIGGAALSMNEVRHVQATMRGIADRRHIKDAQKEQTALEDLLKKASESKWKYADAETVDDVEVV